MSLVTALATGAAFLDLFWDRIPAFLSSLHPRCRRPILMAGSRMALFGSTSTRVDWRSPQPGTELRRWRGETNTDNLFNPLLSPFNVTLPGIRTEIDTFTSSGDRFQPSAVVTLFGGGNDYFAFLDQTTPPTLGQVSTEVAAVTGNIQSDIRALVNAGAKTILVPNIPDIGVTPAYSGTCLPPWPPHFPSNMQPPLIRNLACSRSSSTSTSLSSTSQRLSVLWRPIRPFRIHEHHRCMRARGVPPYPASIFPGTPCTNPNQHLFWDSVHPTAAPGK